jgi:hypothetical protein
MSCAFHLVQEVNAGVKVVGVLVAALGQKGELVDDAPEHAVQTVVCGLVVGVARTQACCWILPEALSGLLAEEHSFSFSLEALVPSGWSLNQFV